MIMNNTHTLIVIFKYEKDFLEEKAKAIVTREVTAVEK